jgi:hypothetical protein
MSRKKSPRVPDYTDRLSRDIHRAALEGDGRRRRPALGIAYFVFAYDPESGPLVRIQENIRYERCCKVGRRYLAYKWVANVILQGRGAAAASVSDTVTLALDEHGCNPCEVWDRKLGCVKVQEGC